MAETTFTPYTYLIGWSQEDIWYYGSRTAINKKGVAHPSDLFVTYFTSSNHVKQLRKSHGEPDVIQIRKTFVTAKQARMWESKVLRRIGAAQNSKFLNKTNGDGKFYNYGHSIDARQKMAEARKGKTHTEVTRQKMAEAQKAYYAYNPTMNVTLYNLKTMESVIVTNLTTFCADRDLSYSGMHAVMSGRNLKHKNWAMSLEPREHALSKNYQFLRNGEIVEITNLGNFCRENGLNSGSMHLVHQGKRLSHKGYTNLTSRGDRRVKTYKFLYGGEIVEITNLRKFCRDNGLNINDMRKVLSGKQKSHMNYVKYGQEND